MAPMRLDSPIAGRVGRNMFLSETLTLWGFQPQTPAYFSLAGKVGKRAHREGTLSMGSLPYVPLPHDDTKGAQPPLDSPAGPIVISVSYGHSRRRL